MWAARLALLAVTACFGLAALAIPNLLLSFVMTMHSFIDGRVWRFADYPRRAEWLKLRAPRAVAARDQRSTE